MRITLDQMRNMLADMYGCSYKDVHFENGTLTFVLPTPEPKEDFFGSEDVTKGVFTGGEIFAEIRREEKELKEIDEGLEELENDHRGDRAWDILVHARAEQEKKVRELKNREYAY